MKRLVVGLSVLTVVIGVSVYAIAQSQNKNDETPAAAPAEAETAPPKAIPLTASEASAQSSAGEAPPVSPAKLGSAFSQDTRSSRFASSPPTQPPATLPPSPLGAAPSTLRMADATSTPDVPSARDPFGRRGRSDTAQVAQLPAQPPVSAPATTPGDLTSPAQIGGQSILKSPAAIPAVAAVTPAATTSRFPAAPLPQTPPVATGNRFAPVPAPRQIQEPAPVNAAPIGQQASPHRPAPLQSASTAPAPLQPVSPAPVAIARSLSASPYQRGTSPTPATYAAANYNATSVATSSGRPGDRVLEGPQSASLVVEKIAPAEIQIGKSSSFVIKVQNTGRADATKVVLQDFVPEKTRFVQADPPASPAPNGSLIWQLGTVKAGEETSVTLELEPTDEGEIGSVATVSFQSQVSARTVATRPLLTLEQTAPPTVLIGGDVVIRVKVANPGTGAASGVILEEDVPEGLSHPAGKALEFEVGTLKPGESRDLELTMKAMTAGFVENVLSARSDAVSTVSSSSRVEITAPEISLGLVGPRKRYLERKATYTVSIQNPGTATAHDVEVIAYLPKGLQFVDTNNQGQYDAQSHAVYWSLEELPARQSGNVELTAMPVQAGQQRIRVEGKAQMGLTHETEQVVDVEGFAALVFSVVDLADPIEVGGKTHYEIHVENQGSKTATNVEIGAILPAGLTPIDGEGPTKAFVTGQQVVFEKLPRLAPKDKRVFRIQIQGRQAGDQHVQVQLQSDDMQSPLVKEERTRVYVDQ